MSTCRSLAGTALAVLLLVTPAAAQEPGVTVGPLAGLSLATWVGGDAGDIQVEGLSLDKDWRAGFAAGVFARLPLAGRLHLEPQVLYVQRGARYTGTVSDPGLGTFDATGTFKVDYVSIPVLLRWRPASAGPVVPSLLAGPALAVRARCRVRLEADGDAIESACGDGVLKGADVGAIVGVGLDIGPFILQGRYEFGLTSLDDTGAGDDIRNGSVLVLVGYAVRLR